MASSRRYAIHWRLFRGALTELQEGEFATVRDFLFDNGFDPDISSYANHHGLFVGDETVDAVRCIKLVQQIGRDYAWFKSANVELRMLRIEEDTDLMPALDDNDN